MALELVLNGSTLTIDKLMPLLKGSLDVRVSISPNQIDKIKKSRDTVDAIIKECEPVYGISTGFGRFKDIFIPHSKQVSLQRNLIISHAACVGPSLEPYQILGIMILRLNCLVRGFSGVRYELLEKLRDAINLNIIPKVPQYGSVGASGDLAPLSHLALGLMGMGEVWNGKEFVEAAEFLKEVNYEPIVYFEKEGLAMNNGTQMMSMLNAETYARAIKLCDIADTSLGMVAWSIKADVRDLLKVKGLSKNQKIVQQQFEAHQNYEGQKNTPRSIQHAIYAHAAIRDTLDHCRQIIEREMNSTSDNPIIDNDNQTAKSGGNFHGEYMAMVADMMAIAIQRLCIYSERRCERTVNAELNKCLPMFLTGQGGFLNGYMIAQYTAAALVSENKVLANPSCVDTVPTSANIEDHVSMGAQGARKSLQVVKNAEYIIAIELMCAVQAIRFMKQTIKLPEKYLHLVSKVIEIVPNTEDKDIFMSHYIERVAEMIREL